MRTLFLISWAICLVSCTSQDTRDWLCKDTAESQSADFAIWCPTQKENYFIPMKYGCVPLGEAVSPPIRWKSVPEGATHLRILVVDTMCESDCNELCMHVHWQLDIPLKQAEHSTILSDNFIAEGSSDDPAVIALTLPNAKEERKYEPICTPETKIHSIVFKAVAYRHEGAKKIVVARAQSSPLLFSFERRP